MTEVFDQEDGPAPDKLKTMLEELEHYKHKPDIDPKELYLLEAQIHARARMKGSPKEVEQIRKKILNEMKVDEKQLTRSLAEHIRSLLNIKISFDSMVQTVKGHDPTGLNAETYYDYFRIASEYVRSQKARFLDKDFEYGMECVATVEEKRRELQNNWIYIKWMGISRYRTQGIDWVDEVDKICPDDVHQGELGNCYFLATLCSMALTPRRIQKLFISSSQLKPYDPQGPWGVWLCIGGIWRQVIVDEYFPFNNSQPNSVTPYFCRPPGNTVWPMILEKCWAKVSYSYADSVEGTCMEAMHCLTGAPCFSYKTRDMELGSLAELVQKSRENKFIMTASSRRAEGGPNEGITPSHAYSLLDISYVHKDPVTQEISFSKQKNVTSEAIIKLRNPWASTNKWNGKYSRLDANLTQEMKKYLYKTPTPDIETGNFWIAADSFKKYFGDIDICHYHDDYVLTTYPMKQLEPTLTKIGNIEKLRDLPYIYEITIKKAGVYYFGANQLPKRAFPPKIRDFYLIVRASLLLYRHDDTKLTYLDGKSSNLLHTYVSHHLSEGTYYLALAAQFKTNFNFITLSAYGPEAVDLKLIHDFKSKDTIRILEYLFTELARNRPETEFQFKSSHPHFKSLHQTRDDGYGYFYFKNFSKDKSYQGDCHIEEFLNLAFLSGRSLTQTTSESFRFTLAPNQEAMFLYIQRDTPNRIRFQTMVTPIEFSYPGQLPDMPHGFGKGSRPAPVVVAAPRQEILPNHHAYNPYKDYKAEPNPWDQKAQIPAIPKELKYEPAWLGNDQMNGGSKFNQMQQGQKGISPTPQQPPQPRGDNGGVNHNPSSGQKYPPAYTGPNEFRPNNLPAGYHHGSPQVAYPQYEGLNNHTPQAQQGNNAQPKPKWPY